MMNDDADRSGDRESGLAGSGGGGDWSGGGLDEGAAGTAGSGSGTEGAADAAGDANSAEAGPAGAAGRAMADPSEYPGEPGGSQIAGLPGEGDVSSGDPREVT